MSKSEVDAISGDEGRPAVRVRIGVAGHRHLSDGSALVTGIERALELARQQVLEGSTPAAFTVVSSLAEGADRLVASVVLEKAGGELEVPLPMAPEEYEKDFESVQSRHEFRRLLALATVQTVVSDVPRPEAYFDAGRAMLRQVDVLIALWDGQPSRGRGGTADIVEVALQQQLPMVLVTPATGQAQYLDPGALRELIAYNRAVLPGPRVAEALEDERKYLVSTEAEQDDPELGTLADWMLPYYVRADALAKDMQDQFYRLGTWVFYLAALAVMIAAGQAIFFPEVGVLAAGSRGDGYTT